jgi:tRNA(fMet)-specific endonuclease VapC
MRGTPSVWGKREETQKNKARFIIPPFVNYEVLRGLIIKPNTKYEKAYNVICDNCTLGEMTVEVWRCAAKIYAELYTKHFTVKDADIVIAAFSIVNNCILVTNNTKDFENIEDLRLVDWVEEKLSSEEMQRE